MFEHFFYTIASLTVNSVAGEEKKNKKTVEQLHGQTIATTQY